MVSWLLQRICCLAFVGHYGVQLTFKFLDVIVLQLRTKWLQKGNTCRLRGLTLRAPTSVKLKRSWAPIMRELVHLDKPILELTLCQRRNILLIFLDSLHWLIVLSLPRFTFQLKSGRKHNINNEASLIKSLYASAFNQNFNWKRVHLWRLSEQMQTTTTTEQRNNNNSWGEQMHTTTTLKQINAEDHKIRLEEQPFFFRNSSAFFRQFS